MLSRVGAPPMLLSADISQLTGDARTLTFWRRIAPPQLKQKASCWFVDSRESLDNFGLREIGTGVCQPQWPNLILADRFASGPACWSRH
jgi:hypothetical protein